MIAVKGEPAVDKQEAMANGCCKDCLQQPGDKCTSRP